MIITLKISNVNLNKVQPYEILVFSDEDLQEFLALGTVTERKKQYAMTINYRQITIECPILKLNDGSYQLIWPSFKLPHRPYPVFVYLFAATLYLSSNYSLRLTAQKVIKTFGLATFSHTNICRLLIKLYKALPYLIRYGAQITEAFGSIVSQVVKRKHWDEQKYKNAQQLNELICYAQQSPPEFGNWLANQYWQGTNSFII